jgi:predicted metal-dependent hydrolase
VDDILPESKPRDYNARMLSMDCSAPLPAAALNGLALFNSGDYFEAHEALESAWRDEPGPIRVLYQGILQVAVTYLHIQRGNYLGAIKVAARSQLKLEACPDTCRGVAVAKLRRDLAEVLAALQRLGPQGVENFDQGLFKAIHYEE